MDTDARIRGPEESVHRKRTRRRGVAAIEEVAAANWGAWTGGWREDTPYWVPPVGEDQTLTS
jgi:hypothetical protein